MSTTLYPFVCADSGKRLSVRKVSYTLADDLRKSFIAPEVPVVEVNYGTAETPNIRREQNKSDPDYLKALAEYKRDFEMRLRRLIVKRGVVIELTADDIAEVAALREDMQLEGVTFSESDKDVWLWRIAITTPNEFQELLDAVMKRSKPSAEGVADAKDRFRTEGSESA